MDEDRSAALEWIEYASSLCSGCSQPKAESFDPDNQYEADPVQCHACAARDAERRAAAKAKSDGAFGDAAFDGIYFGVRKVGD